MYVWVKTSAVNVFFYLENLILRWVYSGFEWRPETESQVCKSPSLVSISQKETETCIGVCVSRPGSDQLGPTPWSCNIIISDTNKQPGEYKMLFALLVMFSVSSPLSISGGTRRREMSHEIINILRFSLTYIHCYLSLLTEIYSQHKYEQRGNKFHNDFIFN